QLRLFIASSEGYDAGLDGEAKRLAVIIRLLLHDTPNSHSLLQQLGYKTSLQFSDMTGEWRPGIMALFGFKVRGLTGGRKYIAFAPVPKRTISFDAWWEAPVIVLGQQGIHLPRAQAVLILANQDGGAHVDP